MKEKTSDDILNYKSVAFDTDGVLVESDPLHHGAFNRVLEEANLEPISWEKYRDEGWIAFSDRDFFEEYARQYSGRKSVDSEMLLKKKQEITRSLLKTQNVSLYEGVKSVIFHLVDDLQVPIFEVTGATTEETQRYFENHPGVKERFSALVSASHEDIPGKPNPACYAEGLRRMNNNCGRSVKPEEVIAVEDSVKGIQAAKGAGMFVIGITNTSKAVPLSRAGADIVVQLLKPELFDALFGSEGTKAIHEGKLRAFLGNPDWLIFEPLPLHLRTWRELSAKERERRNEFVQRVNKEYTPDVCQRTFDLVDELDSLELTTR